MKKVIPVVIILAIIYFIVRSGASGGSSSQPPFMKLDVGETYTVDDLEFTVTSWKFSSYMADKSNQTKASTGNVYCVIYFKVKNNAKSTTTLSRSIRNPKYETKLLYSDGYKYLCRFADDPLYFHSKLNIRPLEEYTGTINYEVPKEVKDNSDQPLMFDFQWGGSNRNVIEWILR